MIIPTLQLTITGQVLSKSLESPIDSNEASSKHAEKIARNAGVSMSTYLQWDIKILCTDNSLSLYTFHWCNKYYVTKPILLMHHKCYAKMNHYALLIYKHQYNHRSML